MNKLILLFLIILISCSSRNNNFDNDPFSMFKTSVQNSSINIFENNQIEFLALKGDKLKNYTVITNDKNNIVLNVKGIKVEDKNINKNNFKYLKDLNTKSSSTGSTINIALKENPGFKVFKRKSGLVLAIGPDYSEIADDDLDDLESKLFGSGSSESLDNLFSNPTSSNQIQETTPSPLSNFVDPVEIEDNDFSFDFFTSTEEKPIIETPRVETRGTNIPSVKKEQKQAETKVVEPVKEKIQTKEEILEDLASYEFEETSSPIISSPSNQDSSSKIKNIEIVKHIDKLRVTVSSDYALDFQKQEDNVNNQLKLIINNTRLPRSLARPFDVSEFNTSASIITAKQTKGPYSNTELIIQFRDQMDYYINQDQEIISIEFPIRIYEEYNDDLDTKVSSIDLVDDFSNSSVNDLEATRQLSKFNFEDYLAQPRKFYGTRMSIEVLNTDLNDVLRLIQDVSGINIVIANDIKDIKVTLSLKNVPWDQVLTVVLQNSGLAYIRQNSVISVAKLETIKNDRLLAAQALEAHRQLELTKIYVKKINYISYENILEVVKPLLSPRGQISIEKGTNNLVVNDLEENILKVDRLLSIIDKKPYQIAIEANIVEASQAWISSMGFDFIGSSGSDFAFKNISGYGDIKSILGVGSATNNLKIISAPRITTLDNKTAQIVQGSQVAYQTINEENNFSKINFENIQIVLSVTPKVSPNNEIILDLDVKREFPDYTLRTNRKLPPGVGVRRATTQVLMKDGDTTVIAGLYSLNQGAGSHGTPGIRMIPIIGWLFGKGEDKEQKNELMIFINARIIDIENTGMASK